MVEEEPVPLLLPMLPVEPELVPLPVPILPVELEPVLPLPLPMLPLDPEPLLLCPNTKGGVSARNPTAKNAGHNLRCCIRFVLSYARSNYFFRHVYSKFRPRLPKKPPRVSEPGRPVRRE
jgi:hypothetical protein